MVEDDGQHAGFSGNDSENLVTGHEGLFAMLPGDGNAITKDNGPARNSRLLELKKLRNPHKMVTLVLLIAPMGIGARNGSAQGSQA